MSDIREAPWTENEVRSINAYQLAGAGHPFTCARRGTSHRQRSDRDLGTLVAYQGGLLCPDCGYSQLWVHASIADGTWRETFKDLRL